MAQVENASASGSTAFRQACLDVASGISDVSLAIGVDKPAPLAAAAGKANIRDLVGSRVVPFTHFALLANEYMNRYGVKPEQVAAVAVKNNRNGARQPIRAAPEGGHARGSDGGPADFRKSHALAMLPGR